VHGAVREVFAASVSLAPANALLPCSDAADSDWTLEAAQNQKIQVNKKRKNAADFDLEVEAAQRARVLKQHEGTAAPKP
jgi:hypothetical protein